MSALLACVAATAVWEIAFRVYGRRFRGMPRAELEGHLCLALVLSPLRHPFYVRGVIREVRRRRAAGTWSTQ